MRAEERDTSSNEFFYIDANGQKQDADFHSEILDNEEANRASAADAVADAIARGMSPEAALQVFGYRPKPWDAED